MRPAIVILSAISTIQIAAVRDIKAALQRFAIEETLTRFHNVVAGEFAPDFVEELHAMMKEGAAYDNLSAKQSGWEISLITPVALLGEFQRPSDNPPAINRAPATPARRQLAFSSKRRKQYQRGERHGVAAHEANAYAKTLR